MDSKQIQAVAPEIYVCGRTDRIFAVPMAEKRRKCAVSSFHGENRGSIPLGRAANCDVLELQYTLSTACQGQWHRGICIFSLLYHSRTICWDESVLHLYDF